MSPVHRLPAHVKVVAALVFVLAVVATPRTAVVVFTVDAVAIVLVARLAGVRWRTLARRLAIETPFVVFALLLPLVARGERVSVMGLSLSASGLWSSWNILVKGTLGVAVAVVLSATTPVGDLLTGIQRLRVPPAFTAIGGFMVRYGEVLSGELDRMRVARVSRGDDPRWLWQARSVATTAGALFVRSFERGERVHLAMVSRGFDGTWPRGPEAPVPLADWGMAASFATVSVVGALIALAVV